MALTEDQIKLISVILMQNEHILSINHQILDAVAPEEPIQVAVVRSDDEDAGQLH